MNANFRASPAEDALKAVLSQAGLSAARDGAIVTVARESGPLVVVRGDKRRIVFDGDGEVLTDDIRGIAEEARQAAAEAMRDTQVDVQVEQRAGGAEDGARGRQGRA